MFTKKLASKFIELEKKENWFAAKLENNLFFWDIVRYNTFMQILTEKGFYEVPQQVKPIKTLSKVCLFLINILLNELSFVFRKKKVYDTIAYSCSRYLDNSGKPIDLILNQYIKKTPGATFYIESYPNPAFKFKTKFRNRYFLYSINFLHKFKKNVPNEEILYSIEKVLNDSFDLNYSWSEFFREQLFKFHNEYKIYKRVLLSTKPQLLLFTGNGPTKAMVKAARELNIFTTEVQHGCLTDVGINLRYPEDINFEQVNSMHHAYLTFSDFWKKKLSNHFIKTSVGHNKFYSQKLQENSSNTFIAISGKFIFQDLFKLVLDLAERLPNYNFIFKLHPNEIDHVEIAQIKSAHIENLTVVFREKNIQELYALSRGLILIHSTCGYEALQAGLEIYIFKKLYYMESEDLFGFKNVFQIEDSADFIKKINKIDQFNSDRPLNPKYFIPFQTVAYKNFLSTYVRLP